ncbi:MAG TPA: pyrroline-5-carboxylate reductase [Phycisphaerae bacterium]|nr:pyrroline-5-carboxylate reductase [Phycisphaerae bacterium]
MSDYQLGIIGCGNMAEAIARGVKSANVLPHSAMIASDPLFERRQFMTSQLGISTDEHNAVPAGCPRVLLAVKPQVMAAVLADIAPAVRADATVISIAAGVTTARIDAGLGGKGHIVRVMPNTPMLVGEGMSAVAAGARATDADVQWTGKLFAACGKTLVVAEPLIDAVTAVSGSGPAYFFYLVEAMIEAGTAEGLDADAARMLAVQTCAGAAKLMMQTDDSPQTLRARVTSPGGTTQRAIETMEAAGVKDALVRAVRAAAERSRELGK